MLKNKAELYISAKEIDGLCTKLAEKIEKDYHGKSLVLICILKGSVVFTSDLIRKIKLPLRIEFVRLASYGEGTESSGNVRIVKDLTADIKGRHVLVVEDILDTGTTLEFFKRHLEVMSPASVKICTLLDKPSRRQKPIDADYCGRKIDDHFVVGYGLDLGEKCRNYPDIWYFKS